MIKNPKAPKEKKGAIEPHPSLKHYTPDEVAETVDGISHPTGIKLWQLLQEIPPADQKPMGGYPEEDMGGDPDWANAGGRYTEYPPEMGTYDKGTVAAIWDKLTPEEQQEINSAMEAQDRYYDNLPSEPQYQPGQNVNSHVEVQDSDGNIIVSGQYYNLRGDNYKIPDVIKVMEIRDGTIVATVDNNPNPIKISSDDIKSQGYSFEKLPIHSNIEKHDLREAVSWLDGDLLSDQPVYDNPVLRDEQRPDDPTSPMTQRESEFTLPTPSGGTLWVRADDEGRVTGWSVPHADGGPGQYSDRDLDRVQSMVDQATIQNRMSMDKTARRSFSPTEQKNLIEEKGDARNKDKLRLDDSHYTESHVEDDIDFLF